MQMQKLVLNYLGSLQMYGREMYNLKDNVPVENIVEMKVRR
ncbi:hypothetical protein [Enterocloster bolteae]|nr:hypothetical protein [Enterocloster bolteae]DAV74668.1 MAG TPA: hypothetical protein [Caudoviricetes sp.]